MGAAKSKNVASAIADVASSISQNTTANSVQASNISQTIINSGCSIYAGKYTATETGNTSQSNTQISKAMQNASVKNDIQQELLQKASSTVGSMGVGFADASNSATMMVNASTSISQQMGQKCNQTSNINQKWVCDRSTITAQDVDINLSSSSAFLSRQIEDDSQIATISNNISQKADQTATATVQGLTGFLIAVALIIAAIGYSLSKPLDSGPVKMIVGAILVIGLFFIVIYVIINKKYPFDAYIDCSPTDNLVSCDSCQDVVTKKINLDNVPLRYAYGITPLETDANTGSNLMQLVISYNGFSSSNNGYNRVNKQKMDGEMEKYKPLAKKLNIDIIPSLLTVPTDPANPGNVYKIPYQYLKSGPTDNQTSICTPGSFIKHIPNSNNPDTCPQEGTIPSSKPDPEKGPPYTDDTIMANLNDDEWNSYLDQSNSDYLARRKFARYVLCDMLDVIPLEYYVDDDEFVNTIVNNNKVTDQAKNVKDNCYKVNISTDFLSSVYGKCTIEGQVGVCHDSKYETKKAMRIAVYSFCGLIVIGSIVYLLWNVLNPGNPLPLPVTSAEKAELDWEKTHRVDFNNPNFRQ